MSLRPSHDRPGPPSMVSMTTPEIRPDNLPTDRARAEEALRLLCGVPVGLDVAVKGLSRGSGVYAWWAAPSIFPDLPDRRTGTSHRYGCCISVGRPACEAGSCATI